MQCCGTLTTYNLTFLYIKISRVEITITNRILETWFLFFVGWLFWARTAICPIVPYRLKVETESLYPGSLVLD